MSASSSFRCVCIDAIADRQDQLLYTKAELQNVQRRAAEEKENAANFGISRLAKDLAESVDVLNLALKSVPEELLNDKSSTHKASKALDELYEGLKLTRKSMLDMLRSHGIEEFDPVGEPFDPTLHEALMATESSEVTEPTIAAVLQPGYRLGERVVRAARVQVANPA